MRLQPIIVVQQLKPLMRTQSSYALRLGRYKVRSLMQALQLKAKRPKQHRYPVAGKPSQIAPNSLNRQFNPPQANVNWTGHITYIRTQQGWLYLAIVLDSYSRRAIQQRYIWASLGQARHHCQHEPPR